MPVGSMQKAQNCEYNWGTLGRRKAIKAKSDVDFESAGVFQGLHEYIDADGTSRILHAHNDGTIKEFVSNLSSTDRVTGLTTGQKVNFTTILGAAFACNSSDALRRGDGATWRVGGAPPKLTLNSVVAGAGSNMAAGDYQCMVVAVIEEGGTAILQSDWSNIVTLTLAAAGSALYSWTATTDARVTHYYVYRTENVGGPMYFAGKVAVGTTTLDSNLSDDDLILNDISDPQFQNGEAPIASIPITAGGRLCLLKLDGKPNSFHISALPESIYDTEYFPTDGRHEIRLPSRGVITAGSPIGVKDEDSNRNDLLIAQEGNIYVLRGTDPLSDLELIASNTGVIGQGAIVQWKRGVFFVSRKGLEWYDGKGDPQLISQQVNPYFEGGGPQSLNGLEGEQFVQMEIQGNRLVVCFRDDSSASWGNKALVLDLEAFEGSNPLIRYTTWYQTDLGFAIPHLRDNGEFLLADNENFRLLFRDETSTDQRDVIDNVLTNIECEVWSGGLLTEMMNARKTMQRVNVFQVSDSDTKLRVVMDQNGTELEYDLAQNINVEDWDEVWDEVWTNGDKWKAGASVSRELTGNFCYLKHIQTNSSFVWTLSGISLIYRMLPRTIHELR